jgi:hypothetical protein
MKAEREQRRQMAKGFEEEKRHITSQLAAAEKALAAGAYTRPLFGST